MDDQEFESHLSQIQTSWSMVMKAHQGDDQAVPMAQRLLMERYGIETVERIRLAGAFGTHIDPVHALVLGLVPDCDPEGVTSAGNAAASSTSSMGSSGANVPRNATLRPFPIANGCPAGRSRNASYITIECPPHARTVCAQ